MRCGYALWMKGVGKEEKVRADQKKAPNEALENAKTS